MFTSPQIPRHRPFSSPYKKAIKQFKVKKLVTAQKNFGTFVEFKAAKQGTEAKKAESTSVVSSLVVGPSSKFAKTLETVRENKQKGDMEDDCMYEDEIKPSQHANVPVPLPPVKESANQQKELIKESVYKHKIFHNTLDEMKKAYLQIKEAEEKEKQEERRKHKEQK